MSSATGRSTPATFTDVRNDAACSWLAVPMTSASDLSGFSWSLFCINQFNVGSAGSESGQTGSCVVSTHRQVQLGVVGVLVVTDARLIPKSPALWILKSRWSRKFEF